MTPSSSTSTCRIARPSLLIKAIDKKQERRAVVSLLAICFCLLVPTVVNSQQTIRVDAASDRTTGDKIRGPADIQVYNLNVLRYDIQVGKTVTFTSGPDLKLPFIPPIPTQAAPTGTQGRSTGGTLTGRFNAFVTRLNNIDTAREQNVQQPILDATTAVNNAKDNLESLMTASDSILLTGGGPTAIITGARALIEPAGTSVIDNALNKRWPDAEIESLLGRLDILKNDVLTLPTVAVPANEPDWSTWYTGGNKTGYDALLARIAELQSLLSGLRIGNSSVAAALKEAQNKLRQWKLILIGIRDGGASAFSRSIHVGCGFGFSDNKETKVELVKRDRLAPTGTAETRQEIVTVVCSSPLSVSAGFGFSTVDERDFVFVPSTKTVTSGGQTSVVVVNRFGFKNKSSFRTLPVLLLNTRVYERSDTFAIHVSAGAGVDLKSGQAGNDVEFIVGPSISFKRTIFLTPGLHIGRVAKLAGGFELGQEVPTGVSEPPIEKAWKPGFAFTVTYKIR